MENYEKLKQPLDERALKPHPSKNYLTVINPMYVIDRLNEVFGLGGWKFTTDLLGSGPGKRGFTATVKGYFKAGDIEVEQYGGSDNDDLGDAMKGAATDALTKCASYIGIGMDIYKGLKDAPQQRKSYGGNSKPPAAGPKPASDKQRNKVRWELKNRIVPDREKAAAEAGVENPAWTSKQASNAIEFLMTCPEISETISVDLDQDGSPIFLPEDALNTP